MQFRLLPALLLLALTAACNGGGGAEPLPTGIVIEDSAEEEGVFLKLAIDKAAYGPDDEVKVRAEAENRGEEEISFSSPVPGEPGFGLVAVSHLREPQKFGESEEFTRGVLGPGKKLKREAAWDLFLDLPATPVQAPPGRYSITAFFLGHRPNGEGIPVSATVTFDVTGTAPVLTPLEAILTAIQQQEVKDWSAARHPSLFCAFEGRFYNVAVAVGDAAETFDFLYNTQVEAGLPICGLTVQGDRWRIVFSSSEGPEPRRLTVSMSLRDGSGVRVE
jgi:hypothetical protein